MSSHKMVDLDYLVDQHSFKQTFRLPSIKELNETDYRNKESLVCRVIYKIGVFPIKTKPKSRWIVLTKNQHLLIYKTENEGFVVHIVNAERFKIKMEKISQFGQQKLCCRMELKFSYGTLHIFLMGMSSIQSWRTLLSNIFDQKEKIEKNNVVERNPDETIMEEEMSTMEEVKKAYSSVSQYNMKTALVVTPHSVTRSPTFNNEKDYETAYSASPTSQTITVSTMCETLKENYAKSTPPGPFAPPSSPSSIGSLHMVKELRELFEARRLPVLPS